MKRFTKTINLPTAIAILLLNAYLCDFLGSIEEFLPSCHFSYCQTIRLILCITCKTAKHFWFVYIDTTTGIV